MPDGGHSAVSAAVTRLVRHPAKDTALAERMRTVEDELSVVRL